MWPEMVWNMELIQYFGSFWNFAFKMEEEKLFQSVLVYPFKFHGRQLDMNLENETKCQGKA